tara:strand:+ start:286 stop:555 length:270 start_codon:yes stop_codon:yes gene_type:complete
MGGLFGPPINTNYHERNFPMTRMTEAAQVQMFGATFAEMDEMREDSMGDAKMLAMSILSDAQESMARGGTETARRWINKAKYVISKIED